MRRAIFVLAILLVGSMHAAALPDSSTEKSGNLCEMHHRFSYNFGFTYDKVLVVGETYDMTVSFSISGAREVSENPYTVTATIVPDGFDVSETKLSLDSAKTIRITPNKEGASLRIETSLTLDGDDQKHRGYTATYKDGFTLDDFTISGDGSAGNGTDGSQTTVETTSTSDSRKVTLTTETSGDKTTTNVSIEEDAPSEVPWYIVRATGMIAYVLLSLSMLTALLKRMDSKRFCFLLRHHHDISLLALLFAFLHMVNNLLDKYMWSLGLERVFWLDFSSDTKTYVSLGVLAFYLMAVVSVTSLSPAIINRIKCRNWRYVHLSSYLLYLLVVVHSLFLGTDLDYSNLGDPVTMATFFVFVSFALLNVVASVIVAVKLLRGKR